MACNALQHLCLQSSCWRAGHGLGEAISDHKAAAEGQRDEERGGATRSAHSLASAPRMTGPSGALRQRHSTPSRRGFGSRPAGCGSQPDADCWGTHAIRYRFARLLWLLPDSSRATEPRSVDPPKIAPISLAAVGEWAQPFQRTAPPWPVIITVPRSVCGRFTDGLLAYVRTPGGPSGPAAHVIGSSGS